MLSDDFLRDVIASENPDLPQAEMAREILALREERNAWREVVEWVERNMSESVRQGMFSSKEFSSGFVKMAELRARFGPSARALIDGGE